jgi:hypothetical protein
MESLATQGWTLEALLGMCLDVLKQLNCKFPAGNVARLGRVCSAIVKMKSARAFFREKDSQKMAQIDAIMHCKNLTKT